MAKEATEKTQISWRMLGRLLFCDFPSGDSVSIDIDKVHESWKDFIWVYGLKQWAKDKIASLSYKADNVMKTAILEAQVAGDSENEKLLRTQLKADRMAWMKQNEADIKKAMFDALKALGEEKTTHEKAERESKAAVEARVKAETIAKMKAGMLAGGMTEEAVNIILANV